MKVTTQLEEARSIHQEYLERLADQDAKIQALPDDTPGEEAEFHRSLFDKIKGDVDRAAETMERLEAIERARRQVPPAVTVSTDTDTAANTAANTQLTQVREPLTYRRGAPYSFFRDMVFAREDPEASARLQRHAREMQVEMRDLTTSLTPGGGGFIPPLYLGGRWIELARTGRPFANAVPKMDLPPDGLQLDFPRVQSGASVAVMATENSALSETDLDTETYSVPVRTIAGLNDVSRQLFDRSQPGIDEVIFRDLLEAHDAYLDTQLLSGTGSNGQHTGIRAVASINTTTYTATTPTAAATVPKLYDAIQLIATNRYREADTIVMHPRRAAWLASNLSSTFPLFQLGALNQASGTQSMGFVQNFAGLNVILDANVGTTYGAGTNEDEIYVVRIADLALAEGPLQTRVYDDVGSGTLTVRLQLWSYSAFAGGRYAKSITKVSGTGLAAPTF